MSEPPMSEPPMSEPPMSEPPVSEPPMSVHRGYREPCLSVLRQHKVRVWSEVLAETTSGRFQGLILPRSETSDALHIVLKLWNGYNIGLRHDIIQSMTELDFREAKYEIPQKEFPRDESKPNVKLFGTGGTIASRLDYRTGAVIPAFSPGELYGSVPELADVCNLETEKLFGVFSENMGAEQYLKLAEEIGKAIRAGYHGIVVGHGTDTMHHTASALSFMVQNPPIPIVMVGSQRSSDRPSSDAARNLLAATRAAAHGDIAEVMVCMFGPTSDSYNLLHRGTRVRKMHSSFRSTFRTLGDIPLAMVKDDEIEPLKRTYAKRRNDREVSIQAAFSDRATVLYYYPNMQADLIDAMVEKGYKGIVIAGTGLGHVNRTVYPALERARAKGVLLFMTLQTLWGFVQMQVYETGREILGLGVVPLANMLPEVAYIKLAWALGLHPDDPDKVVELMKKQVANETSLREPHDGYLVLQGGVPEVEDFMKRIWL